jgi:hypothetical protein
MLAHAARLLLVPYSRHRQRQSQKRALVVFLVEGGAVRASANETAGEARAMTTRSYLRRTQRDSHQEEDLSMPQLISIAVETPPGHYIALDSRGRVWRGLQITKSGGPIAIKWAPIPSEFPRRSEAAKLYGGVEQDEDD